MVQRSTTAEGPTGVRAQVACAVLCAGALLSGMPAATQQTQRAEVAYRNGKRIVFKPAAVKRGRVLVLGDTIVGPLGPDHKPSDKRLNLYVISPGTPNDGHADDYNLVVSGLPRTDEPVDWDLYWVAVLDPALRADLRGERDLLLAAQEAFVPGELFEFDDIPGAALLRDRLDIDSIAGLARFRRPDGTMPRVVIVQSAETVRASAIDPDAPPPESRISRALSRLHKKPTPSKQSVRE